MYPRLMDTSIRAILTGGGGLMEYTPRRKLTREFKLEAVRQVALSEKPKGQLARERGARVGQLRTRRLAGEKAAVTRERGGREVSGDRRRQGRSIWCSGT